MGHARLPCGAVRAEDEISALLNCNVNAFGTVSATARNGVSAVGRTGTSIECDNGEQVNREGHDDLHSASFWRVCPGGAFDA